MKRITLFGVLVCCFVSVAPKALARPKLVCGGQYAGKPYLNCQREEGREAIPMICTRHYRNCNGQQVYLFTSCVGPVRGSGEHQVLNAFCDGLGAYDRVDESSEDSEDGDDTLPYDFEYEAIMSSEPWSSPLKGDTLAPGTITLEPYDD